MATTNQKDLSIQMVHIDDQKDVHQLYPKTKDKNVTIESTNKALPTGITTLKDVVDKLGDSAFSSSTVIGITADERNKLKGIEAGAQVNMVDGVKGDAETYYRTGDVNITKANIGLGSVENKSSATIRSEITSLNVTSALGYTPPKQDTTYADATTTNHGLMSTDDKIKLDGIAPDAQVNSITGVKGDSESTYRTGNVNITKANVGLGNVENKSSATIRGELTSANVTSALGYAPPRVNTTYDVATTSTNGLMSASDKTKLDNLDSTISTAISNALAKYDNADTTVAFLPDYYKSYLSNKISEIKSAKSANPDALCFWMFTDYHYHYKDQTVGNSTGVGDIINYVGSQVGTKQTAFVGDFLAYENTQTLVDSAMSAFKTEVKAIGSDNIWIIKGNHDNNPYGNPNVTDETLISDIFGMMSDAPTKTYYYRDDVTSKVRVIVLDSRETSLEYSYTNGSDTEKAFATVEAKWFGDTLSSMPSGYTALVFSHIMWWGSSDKKSLRYSESNVQVEKIMHAYNARTSYNGIGTSFNFANGKGTAPIMLTGHTHKDFVDVFDNDVVVLSTSADSWAFANDRPDYYTHANGTTTEHALDFVLFDPTAKTMDTIRIGAGANRHFEFGSNRGLKCTIKNTLSNCTSNNSATTAYKSYAATITPNSGYKMGSCAVTMRGADMSNYVSTEESKASINLPNLIGDIVINASAVAIGNYSVTNNLTNCINSNSATSVTEGASYTATITAKSGYNLQSVSCTMGGTAQTVTDGKISISKVTGNIVITATATSIPVYTITNNLTNCTNSNTAVSVKQNDSYSATITANSGYTLVAVTCTMGGTANTVTNGKISISNVTGNIVITASAIAQSANYTNILAEVGYHDDNYLSGASGMKASSAGDVTTGYIDVSSYVNTKWTMYIKGYTGDASASHTRLRLQSSQTESITEYNGWLGTALGFTTITKLADGYYKVEFNKLSSYFESCNYIRMCFAGTKGGNLIITINEPIE